MIKMTRQQYQQKYGASPSVQTNRPVEMTRQEYEQKYGGQSQKNFASNVLTSGAKFIGDTAKAVLSPVQTAKSILGLGSGLVQLMIPGEQGNEELARNVGRFYVDRYGSLDKAWNSFYNDPVGVAADVAAVFSGVGAAAKGVGGLTKAAGLSNIGNKAIQVAGKIDPLSAIGRGASSVAKKGISGLDEWSRGYATAGIGNPAQIREANRILGRTNTTRINPVTGKSYRTKMTAADLISEGNLYGRSADDLSRYSSELSSQFDKIANNPNLAVKAIDITEPLDKLIESTKQAIKDFPNEKSFKIQLGELTRQRQNMASKAVGGVIRGDEALRMRRSLDSVTSDAASRGVTLRPGEMQAKQAMVSGLRSGLRGADPRLTGLGKKMQAIGFDSPGKEGPLMKAFSGYQSRAEARNPITLSGTAVTGIGAGAGALFGPYGAAVGAVGANLAKNALTSPAGIKTVSRGGQSFARNLGTAGRTVSKSTQAIYPTLRQARMLNQTSDQMQSQFPQTVPQVNQELIPYSPILPPVAPKRQALTKEIKYSPPKNVFSNKSNYGRTFRLKAGSFN